MKIGAEIRLLPWQKYEGPAMCAFRIYAARKNMEEGRIYILDFVCNEKEHKFDDFRVVLSKKLKDYRIFTKENPRSHQKSLHQCFIQKEGWCGPSRFSYFEADEKTMKIIAEIIPGKIEDSGNHGLPELEHELDMIRDAKKKERDKAMGKIEDDLVYECPEELPPGLEDFVRQHILPKDKVIIYKKGNCRGTCSVCGQKVTGRFVQSESVRCPVCGTMVICILENSARWKAEHVDNVAFMQKGKDGETVFIRQIRIERDVSVQYEPFERYIEETARYAIRGNQCATWQHFRRESRMWGSYEYKTKYWERMRNRGVYDGWYTFWDETVDEAVQRTKLQYASIRDYLQNEQIRHPNVIKYIMDCARYPVMEFLYKKGFTGIVAERTYGCVNKEHMSAILWQRNVLKECFRCPLSYLDIMKPHLWSLGSLYTVNQLCDVLSPEEVKVVLDSGMVGKDLREVLSYMSFSRMKTYIEKQRGKEQEVDFFGLYRDYLRECVQLRYDMTDKSILFPKNLRSAHERTMQLVEYENNRELYEAFEKRAKKLKKLAYHSGGYMVVVPGSASDLKKEGAALHHCVGGYAERMAKGETVIVFIRRAEAPDTAFYTLEYRNGHVVQCRTKNNASYESAPEVKAFVDEWLLYIKQSKKKGEKNDRRNRKTA